MVDEYDVTNLDTTVEIASEGLVLPLGTTDSVKVAQYIDDLEMDLIKRNENGEFALSKKDSFDFSENLPDLTNIKVDAQHVQEDILVEMPDMASDFTVEEVNVEKNNTISFGDLSFSDMQMPDVTYTREYPMNPGIEPPADPSQTIPVNHEFGYDGQVPVKMTSYKLPQDVKSIKRINFTPGSKISLSMAKKNMSDVFVQVSSIRIKFPKEMIVEGADADNTITLIGPTITDGGFYDEVNLIALDLSATAMPEEGYVEYNGQIQYDFVTNISVDLSSDMEPSSWVLDMNMKSDIVMDNAVITYDDMEQPLPDDLEDSKKIELTGLKDDYGIIRVIPEGSPAIHISMGMPSSEGFEFVTSESGIKIQVPEYMKLINIPASCTYDEQTNIVTVYGAVPETLDLEIGSLLLEPYLENDAYYIDSYFAVTGSVKILGGEADTDRLQSLDNQEIISTVHIPEIVPAEISVEEFIKDVNKEFDFSTTVTDGMENISRIDKVYLKDAYINFDLSMLEPYVDFGADMNMDIEVLFPDMMLFDDSRIIEKTVDGVKVKVLRIRDILAPDQSVRVEDIRLSGLVLNREVDGALEIAEKIKVNVRTIVENPQIDISTMQDMTLRAVVDVTEAPVSEFEGLAKFTIDPVVEEMTLDKLPEEILQDGLVLDIADPVLVLKVRSNVGVPIDGVLSIVPYSNGSPIEANAVRNLEITLPAADMDKDVTETCYWIGPDTGMPAGYTRIDADLAGLIRQYPDVIKINFDADVDDSGTHHVKLDKPFVAEMEYSLEAPLKFGEDFNVPVQTKVEDLPQELSTIMTQILNQGSVIKLLAKAESNLPLEMDMVMTALDKSGAPTFLKSNTVVVKPCDAEGKTTVTEFELVLDTEDRTDLPEISALLVNFNAHSGGTMVANVGIDDGSYLRMELALKVEGGIVLDEKLLNGK